MVAANLIFVASTFTLKLIPSDMFDIMIVRFFVQSVVFGLFARCYKRYSLFDTNGQPLACLMNAFMSSVTILLYIAALYFLPLSDLNTIKYTYIVWTAILSVIFLKDRFKAVNAVALLFTASGLLFATKPDLVFRAIHLVLPTPAVLNLSSTAFANGTTTESTNSPTYYLGIVLASLSALTKAIQMIARKQLVKTKLPYAVMNFQFTITALFVSLTYSCVRRIWYPGPFEWKWMLIAGTIFGGLQLITNTFLAKALKRENVQVLAIVGSLDIVYAVILQYIFFRQTKTWLFYLGASLIVVSAVILSVDRHRTNKRERQQRKMKAEYDLVKNTA